MPSRAHPAERHVGGADGIGAQDDLVERVAAAAPRPATLTGSPSARRPSAEAVAPAGDLTGTAGDRRRRRSPRWAAAASSTAASTQPAARSAADVGGPTTSTSSTTRPGRHRATAAAMPGVRATRSTPVPSSAGARRRSAAAWGRGGRRPRGRTPPAPAGRAGRPAGVPPPAPARYSLPPKAPPLARGVAGSPPGRHQDAVRLDVGRLDPRRAQGRRPSPRAAGRADGRASRPLRRPWTLPAWRPGLGERLAHRPSRRRRPERRPARRPAPCRRRSRPRPSATAGPTRCGVPPSRVARRAGGDQVAGAGSAAGDVAGDRRHDRAPTRAPAQVGEQRLLDRAPASGPARGGASGGQPHDDARACRTRTGWRRPRRRRRPNAARTGSARPSSVVTARPATRRAGVTQATRGMPSTSTVQQPHWPWGLHPSLTDATTQPVPEHLEERCAVVGDLDLAAVDLKSQAHGARIG